MFNLPQPTGFLVQRVAQGSPSAKIGLRGGTVKATIEGQPMTVRGDIILRVQGIAVGTRTAYERMQQVLSQLPQGAQARLTVLREGRQIELSGRLP